MILLTSYVVQHLFTIHEAYTSHDKACWVAAAVVVDDVGEGDLLRSINKLASLNDASIGDRLGLSASAHSIGVPLSPVFLVALASCSSWPCSSSPGGDARARGGTADSGTPPTGRPSASSDRRSRGTAVLPSRRPLGDGLTNVRPLGDGLTNVPLAGACAGDAGGGGTDEKASALSAACADRQAGEHS